MDYIMDASIRIIMYKWLCVCVCVYIYIYIFFFLASQVVLVVKSPPSNAGMQEVVEMLFQFLGWGDLLKEGMANHSSILAWRIPWTEESGKQITSNLHRKIILTN